MIYSGSGSLPRHEYVFITPNTIGDHDWLEGVWFGISSYPGRMWGCHILLECGAVYRNIPLHHLASHKDAIPWNQANSQKWDCYGWDFSTIIYPYLDGLDVQIKSGETGRYLFSATPIGDGFTAVPEQNKEFFFLRLENGRYTSQPTNNVIFKEKSFTKQEHFPSFLKRQTEVYECE